MSDSEKGVEVLTDLFVQLIRGLPSTRARLKTLIYLAERMLETKLPGDENETVQVLHG